MSNSFDYNNLHALFLSIAALSFPAVVLTSSHLPRGSLASTVDTDDQDEDDDDTDVGQGRVVDFDFDDNARHVPGDARRLARPSMHHRTRDYI